MQSMFTINRLLDRPIVDSSTNSSIGENIQGPSLIRVPDWVGNPLGRYYLYFADHKGSYIRLAYADELTGPWTIHEPGSLQLSDSKFLTESPKTTAEVLEQAKAFLKNNPYPHDIVLDLTTPHIASPDVHVDYEAKKIVMYFHGLEAFATQLSRVATSDDGIHFVANDQILGRPYMRVFDYQGYRYALSIEQLRYGATGRVVRPVQAITSSRSG